VSASSTVRPPHCRLLIAVLLLLVLSACSRNSTRPAIAPPQPPEVRCAPAPADALPPVPDCTSIPAHECMPLMDEWAIEAMGVAEKEGAKGHAARTCEGALRANGAIR